jgi:hypothetical protein
MIVLPFFGEKLAAVQAAVPLLRYGCRRLPEGGAAPSRDGPGRGARARNPIRIRRRRLKAPDGAGAAEQAHFRRMFHKTVLLNDLGIVFRFTDIITYFYKK